MSHWSFGVWRCSHITCRPAGAMKRVRCPTYRCVQGTANGVCLLPSTFGTITGWETCCYEELWYGQDARSTGVVCFSTHVAPLGLWGVVILTCYKHVAPLGLVKHNTYRTNRTQLPVTYELTSLAFCASGKMPDLRVVLVMAYGARAISHVVLLGLTRNNG